MAKVFVERDGFDNIEVTMPYDEDAKEALKEKFQAKWDPDDKTWNIDERKHDIEDVIAELKLHFPRDL